METAYDWITVALFAGLVTLFLHRSVDSETSDSIWQYLIPSTGCAIANYLGNEGWHLPAVAVLVATIAYILRVLRPIDFGRKS